MRKRLRPEAHRVLHGCCIEVMRQLPANSVDSIVTDPPYGLTKPPPIEEVLACWLAGKPWKSKLKGFMNREWDACVPGPEYWKEAIRVLKPGGHLVAFAGSRTVDLMGIALRLAGFEIRDSLQWLYGSGMPKSYDVSKGFDKAAGAERPVVGTRALTGSAAQSLKEKGGTYSVNTSSAGVPPKIVPITKPATDEAKEWDGFGTALKPAVEPIILARKPLEGTIVENVRKWGTGALNVDGCRIGTTEKTLGRHPANVLMDGEAGEMLDQLSGNRPGMAGGGKHKKTAKKGMFGKIDGNKSHIRKDKGGASRFFYSSKVPKHQRNAGLDSFEAATPSESTGRVEGSVGINNGRAGTGRTGGNKNTHETVKPISVMCWLVRLVTPPGGTVLDPFNGSGSTGCATVFEGFRYIGIEKQEQHVIVSRVRISAAVTHFANYKRTQNHEHTKA